MQELLTVEDVARILKLPIQAVRKHLRERRIKAIKLGRFWRVRPEDLEAFINDAASGGGKK